LTNQLLADIWQVSAGSKKPHPALRAAADEARKVRAESPTSAGRARALAAARRRAAARRERIEAGDIV
jgi:hypothetical protein